MAKAFEPVMSWATASAKSIDPNDAGARRAAKKRGEAWQTEAFVVAGEIGEIRNAYRFQANALSRLRLFAGYQQKSDQPTVPLDPENKDQLEFVTAEEMQVVTDTMLRLRSPEHDQQALIADIATQLFLPGEGYLVNREDDDGDRWDFYSIAELLPEQNGWRLECDNGEKEILDEKAYIARIHVASPDRRYKPDSAMRSLIGECRALDLLTRAINAAAMSRLNAGILKLPEEMSFTAVQADADDPVTDPLIEDLIAHFTTPVADPDSAAAVVPFILKAKKDLLDGVQWVSIARDFDKLAVQLRAELIERLANGLELPTDALVGKGGLNHWSAWSVDEDTFRFYLEPRAQLICAALTTAFLRPQLLLVGVEDVGRFKIGYDKADLVSHPNQVQAAKDDWADGLISDDARRRVNGWADDDAPDEEELAARRASQVAQIPAAPAAPETVAPGPPAAVAASARTAPRTLRLAYRLLDLDRATRVRLHTASELAVSRALERAGARTRAKSRKDASVLGALRDAGDPDNAKLCLTLGRATVLTRLALTEAKLVDDDAFATLESQWTAWVGGAQRTMLHEIAKIAPLGGRAATLEYRADRDLSGGWNLLNQGLLAVARTHLFGLAKTDTPPRGEYDPTAIVPIGLIRRALIAAGDGANPHADTFSITAAATTLDGQELSTGATNGMLFFDAVEAAGMTRGPKVWVHGSPKTPFLPHEDLDGFEFRSWTNDALMNTGDWPEYDSYFPGDHEDCTCDYLQLIE